MLVDQWALDAKLVPDAAATNQLVSSRLCGVFCGVLDVWLRRSRRTAQIVWANLGLIWFGICAALANLKGISRDFPWNGGKQASANSGQKVLTDCRSSNAGNLESQRCMENSKQKQPLRKKKWVDTIHQPEAWYLPEATRLLHRWLAQCINGCFWSGHRQVFNGNPQTLGAPAQTMSAEWLGLKRGKDLSRASDEVDFYEEAFASVFAWRNKLHSLSVMLALLESLL